MPQDLRPRPFDLNSLRLRLHPYLRVVLTHQCLGCQKPIQSKQIVLPQPDLEYSVLFPAQLVRPCLKRLLFRELHPPQQVHHVAQLLLLLDGLAQQHLLRLEQPLVLQELHLVIAQQQNHDKEQPQYMSPSPFAAPQLTGCTPAALFATQYQDP